MADRPSWFWIPPSPPPLPSSVGGKGMQLSILSLLAKDLGARVPHFIVLRTEAYAAFAEMDTPQGLPPELGEELAHTLRIAGLSNSTLAVRSSATGEDGAAASFAGQFDTILGVPASDRDVLHGAIRKVWSSVGQAHAVAYRAQHGEGKGVAMAVILQEMVEPFAAGVAFATDPVTGSTDTAVVSAVPGLGEGLVSGELDADTWHVGDDATPLRFSAAVKTHMVRLTSGGGTTREPLAANQQRVPVLSEVEVRRIAAAVRSISAAQGAPQDVEWAMVRRDGGLATPADLILLQTRPITTLPASTDSLHATSIAVPPPSDDPGGAGRRVWDNSNIIESYAGVTTPLTFTFARSVYESVYRQFCALMGVSAQHMAESESAFSHMLGLVRGRVYYSLINWYRLIALLPGFEWNRSFMERMMGVREALEAPPAPPGSGSRARDFVRLLSMLVRMIREQARLSHTVPAFHTRVAATLDPLRGVDLSTWEATAIAALYRRLERELLDHWRPPLVNDFFAMIHFGVLGRLITRWLPDAAPTLCNDLLCGEGGIISTQPARRVMTLAREVRDSPGLHHVFIQHTDDGALWRELITRGDTREFAAKLHEYIESFGDRCLEELKLETLTLREDPTFLVRMVRAYIGQGAIDPDAALAHEQSLRKRAESTVTSHLSGWREACFMWVLGNTRARVRDRENLRFERTRVFGMVRRMVLGFGEAFTGAGYLRHPRDVFWLSIEEILAVAEQRSPGDALDGFVHERRDVFARWEQDAPPPDRFETTGPLGEWSGPREVEIPRSPITAALEGDLSGTGCCPGVIRAPVCIVRDPRQSTELTQAGGARILVAERTDPGWTLLFPAAAGLLVQRGSLLSHSAIVAREMALPCIVGIAGLLDTLVDGEVVEMDGTTGIVRRHIEGTA